MKLFVGVDIGGTKIAIVLVNERGRILKSDEFPVRDKSPKYSIQELIRKTQKLIGTKKISGIGIGTPGPVNPNSGKIPWAPNLPKWKGIPICNIMKQKFRVPAFIENDANAAALCEYKFGWGRGKKDMIYVTVSTGVGGGLILDGKLYSGSSFNGGELGHITVVPNGNLCGCGKHGCLEAHASGTAIGSAAKHIARMKPHSVLASLKKKYGKLNSKVVKEAALKNDREAKEILGKAGMFLGIAIGNLLNLLNPEIIVLGGGVMKGKIDSLWKPMIETAKKESWSGPYKNCRIIKTKFQDHVGALGAASLAIDKVGRLS